jgi:hypothetical protein
MHFLPRWTRWALRNPSNQVHFVTGSLHRLGPRDHVWRVQPSGNQHAQRLSHVERNLANA